MRRDKRPSNSSRDPSTTSEIANGTI
jgi:hypothetical protein